MYCTCKSKSHSTYHKVESVNGECVHCQYYVVTKPYKQRRPTGKDSTRMGTDKMTTDRTVLDYIRKQGEEAHTSVS